MKRRNRILIIIILLILLIIGGVIGYHVYKKNKGSSYRPAKPNPQLFEKPHGIDISHHNKAYNWSKVHVQFCYVRATLGKSFRDTKYNSHRKNVALHKIPMGAYHFLTASSGAKEQFAFFSSVAKRNHFQLRPMLDVEESKDWNAPKDFTDHDAHNLIREWCNLCKKHYGIAPIIYTTEKLYKRYKLNKGFEDCIWWVANYNGIRNYDKKCTMPFTLHQYSNKKRVEGLYGYVDCNRFAPTKSVNDLLLE